MQSKFKQKMSTCSLIMLLVIYTFKNLNDQNEFKPNISQSFTR